MDPNKRKRLEAKGWKVGGVDTFLGLTAVESAMIEVKLALRRAIREWRLRQNISQEELARRMGSSQPRIAAVEAGDPHASIDLLVRALLELGASRADISALIVADASSRNSDNALPERQVQRRRTSRGRQQGAEESAGMEAEDRQEPVREGAGANGCHPAPQAPQS